MKNNINDQEIPKPSSKTQKVKAWLIIPLTLLGALFYRMRGGFGIKLPRPLDQILFNLFPSLILSAMPFYYVWLVWNHLSPKPEVLAAWIVAWFLANVWAVVWECSGHGGPMDLATNPKEPDGTTPETKRDLEKIEYLFYPWLYKKVSRYWYDFTVLAATGFVVTLAPGIFLIACGAIPAGVCLALSGALKAPGYAIGRKLFNNTEAGEWISGGLRTFAATLIFYFLL